MSKLIFGEVTGMHEAYEGCKCNWSDPEFRVNNENIMDHLDNGSVQYMLFNSYPDELAGLEGMHYDSDPEYEKIKNHCTEQHLMSLYLPTESMYRSTCYSEWTCGDPDTINVVRVDELKFMFGKYIVFFIP